VDTKSILKGGNEVNSLGVWWRREQGRVAAVAERAMVDKAHWELPGARRFWDEEYLLGQGNIYTPQTYQQRFKLRTTIDKKYQ
jgi:hypothetical protein